MKLRAPGPKPVLLRPVFANAGEEAAYRRELQRLVRAMARSAAYWVEAAWRQAGLAQDAGPEATLAKAMKRLAKQWQASFDAQARSIAKRFASGALKSHDAAFGASLRKAGFTVRVQHGPEVQAALDEVVSDNVALIRSIPAEYFADLTEKVRESVEKGRAMKELTELLRDRFGVTMGRAALIARDQNNKATARIHRARQKQVGIRKAAWVHTSASRHPREEHEQWYAEGATYDVDTGMFSEEDGEHVWPGTPINCGCTSMSVVPGTEDEGEEGE